MHMIETHVIFLLLVVTLGYNKFCNQTLLTKKANSGDCQKKKTLKLGFFIYR